MSSSATVPSIFDISGLAALKGAVKKDDPKALKAAAQQFEALFLQMMLKSMRDATPHEGPFDSEQTRMYESLLDQQLSQAMSTRGSLGLAAMLEKQLSRASADPVVFEDGLPLVPAAPGFRLNGMPTSLPLEPRDGTGNVRPLDPAAVPVPGSTGSVAPGMGTGALDADGPVSPAAREFVGRVWPYAVEASRKTGIPAHFLVAHAALETGWGRSEPRLPDGSPSHNLFGIKAGRSWSGESVEAVTTEVVDGVSQRRLEPFRAYGSYAESFADYANLLKSNPRYAAAVGARDGTSFAQALQRGGYATDPMYAAKLDRIISGNTLRKALAA